MKRIGFIGLGHMGFPMASNLLRAGYQVTGYDIQQEVLEHFAAAGGAIAQQAHEAADGQDIIITMLQTGQQVLQICHDLLPHVAPGSLYIDCSTIDVHSARVVHAYAKERHLLVVDAPVSGGVAAANAGTLTFMVGGDDTAYHAASSILSVMGQKIIHTGAAGSGQAAKICNNMILGVSMIAVSEAFTLAEQLGLSATKLFDVVTHASGQCWAMSHYAPVPGLVAQAPANNDYRPGFAANMMLKDLHLSQSAAQETQVSTPLGAKATELYEQMAQQGLGGLDFSAIIQLIHQTKDVNKL